MILGLVVCHSCLGGKREREKVGGKKEKKRKAEKGNGKGLAI